MSEKKLLSIFRGCHPRVLVLLLMVTAFTGFIIYKVGTGDGNLTFIKLPKMIFSYIDILNFLIVCLVIVGTVFLVRHNRTREERDFFKKYGRKTKERD